jgi:hypothetical protein
VKFSLATGLWMLAYLAVVAAVIGGAFAFRNFAFSVYGSPEAQAQWDAWRADAKKMEEQPGTVKRRAPKSAEPPALVLMRDHFLVCLVGAVVLSMVLFSTFMMFVRGASSEKSRVGVAHRRL